MSRTWFNGSLVEGPLAVDRGERGLLLGDGLFETILVLNRTPLWGNMHFLRLEAAAQELGQAAFALASIFKSGECGELSNPAVADVWLRRAAELKYVPAQFELGRQGLAHTDDPLQLAEAVRLIARAARKGHAAACYTLSACYARGLALEVDPARAWAWLTLAAQRGDARAELKLPERFDYRSII